MPVPPSITLAVTPAPRPLTFCAMLVSESVASIFSALPLTTAVPVLPRAEVVSAWAAEAILFALASAVTTRS